MPEPRPTTHLSPRNKGRSLPVSSDNGGMGRLRTRWLGVVLLLIVVAGGVAWLSVYLSSRGFDWAARFSEIASFVLAALSLVPLVAGKIAQWVPTPKIKDEQVDYDANALVRQQPFGL